MATGPTLKTYKTSAIPSQPMRVENPNACFVSLSVFDCCSIQRQPEDSFYAWENAMPSSSRGCNPPETSSGELRVVLRPCVFAVLCRRIAHFWQNCLCIRKTHFPTLWLRLCRAKPLRLCVEPRSVPGFNAKTQGRRDAKRHNCASLCLLVPSARYKLFAAR